MRLGGGGSSAVGSLSRGGRAAVLEPQDRQRARYTTEEAAGRSAGIALPHPICGDAARGREVARGVSVALRPAAAQGDGDAGTGLGANGGFLWLPEGALETPANDQPSGVALRGGAAADGGRQTVQEGGQRDRADLACTDGG